MEQKKKHISKEIAVQKLQAYCAYQERCHSEVMTKLRDLGIFGDTADAVVAQLIEDNFLNEERFAIAYARGKFRMKSWGKMRIQQELKMRHIPDYSIAQAMKAVDTEGGYLETLERVLKQKSLEYTDDERQKTAKLYAYAFRRGFESELISDVLKRMRLGENEF